MVKAPAFDDITGDSVPAESLLVHVNGREHRKQQHDVRRTRGPSQGLPPGIQGLDHEISDYGPDPGRDSLRFALSQIANALFPGLTRDHEKFDRRGRAGRRAHGAHITEHETLRRGRVAQEPIHESDEMRAGAVVFMKRKGVTPRRGPGFFEELAAIRVPEPINRLAHVAHAKKPVPSGELIDELGLKGVGVLILIHQDEVNRRTQALENAGPVQKLERFVEKIVEIEDGPFPLHPGIFGVEIQKHPDKKTAQKRGLPVGQRPEQIPDGFMDRPNGFAGFSPRIARRAPRLLKKTGFFQKNFRVAVRSPRPIGNGPLWRQRVKRFGRQPHALCRRGGGRFECRTPRPPLGIHALKRRPEPLLIVGLKNRAERACDQRPFQHPLKGLGFQKIGTLVVQKTERGVKPGIQRILLKESAAKSVNGRHPSPLEKRYLVPPSV